MQRRLRVFHLIKSLGRGGAEVLLAEGPGRADIRSCDYAFGYFVPWKNAVVPSLTEVGNEVTCFPAEHPLELMGELPAVIRELRRWRADLVHCHLPLASVVGRVAGKRLGIPVVSTEHNLLEHYHPATRALSLLSWRLQAQVIAVSDEVAASIRRHAPSSVPVEVVQNGVSLRHFDPSRFDAGVSRRELGVPEGAAVVGTVAVLRKQKRFDVWLDAAVKIARQADTCRFLIVGDGPLRSELEAQIRARGLEARVILPGLCTDVRPLLAAMDVYMMSSDTEGLPVALLEAMAMERVPVVTGVGGIPEVVSESNGRLVPRRDAEALASAALEILARPERAALGAAARRTVEQRFSIERMLRQTEELYRRVVSGVSS